MTDRFKGKNSLQSIEVLMSERAKYSIEALPNVKESKDLHFAEKVLYGRVDNNMNPIVPKKSKLKAISNNREANTVVVIDFVADAFEQFNRVFVTAVNGGQINRDDPYLSELTPMRGYVDPKVLYFEDVSETIGAFNQIYLSDKKSKVMNPKEYLSEFMVFIKQMAPLYPLTYTAWQRSRNSSLFTSGLAIDLTGLDISDDVAKEMFIESENFDFYRNACVNMGFAMVKNAPWIIVADLGSPALSVYHKKYYLSNNIQIFSAAYDKALDYDLDYMKQLLYEGYEQFARSHLYNKEFNICNNNKLLINNIYRQQINIEKFENMFDISYWLEFYTKVRNIEEDYIFSESDVKEYSMNAKNLEKVVDKSKAMGYINEQYRSVYKSKPGGVNYFIRRAMEQKKEEESRSAKAIFQNSGGTNTGGY